jgi:hypothetical protein
MIKTPTISTHNAAMKKIVSVGTWPVILLIKRTATPLSNRAKKRIAIDEYFNLVIIESTIRRLEDISIA